MRLQARLLSLAVTGLLATSACERLPPTAMTPMPMSVSLNSPDEAFRLTAAERANVPDIFDADALERLLAWAQPDKRPEILAHFQIQPADGQHRGHLVEFLDPRLQPLLEEVWAPLWRNATDQEIEANIYGLPGRMVAKQRREARGRDNGPQPR